MSAMNEPTEAMEAANEQAANDRYMSLMREKVERRVPVAVPRSSKWTGTGLPTLSEVSVGPLVGRVGLDRSEDFIGSNNFYIGPWHVDHDGLVVFSWAAPIAATFYGTGLDRAELDAEVLLCRTLHLQDPGPTVASVHDEWQRDPIEPHPFRVGRRLSIPKPPPPAPAATPTPASRTINDPAPGKPTTESSQPSTEASQHAPAAPEPPPDPVAQETERPAAKQGPKLRAENAVRAALAAPRGASLPTLLGTLQPDQYDFVTRPLQPPLVIQGHPGTGKTVIAAHRAAYLLHPETTQGRPPPRILMIGPNDSYARHVTNVLDALIVGTRDSVTAVGIARFLANVRRIQAPVSGPQDGTYFEVSIELGDYADAAAHELAMAGALNLDGSPERNAEIIYEALKANSAAGVALSDDTDSIRSLKRLPRWPVARSSRQLLPLLAQCSLSGCPISNFTFDHIIVDEAQDIRPLEWRILKAANPTVSWTLLGDMNQRRSDWSYASWTHIARDLDLIDDTEDFQPTVFKRGYRSTAPIISFANQLLPKDQRQVDCIQTEGPEPAVVSARAKELLPAVSATAVSLCDKYHPGTTAIIAIQTKAIGDHLLREGWRQDPHDRQVLKRDDRCIRLLKPDSARGLEFDAVIVVEPGAFPPNIGRMGSLYTSLTRANRELAVIHSRPLPDGLRARKGVAAKT